MFPFIFASGRNASPSRASATSVRISASFCPATKFSCSHKSSTLFKETDAHSYYKFSCLVSLSFRSFAFYKLDTFWTTSSLSYLRSLRTGMSGIRSSFLKPSRDIFKINFLLLQIRGSWHGWSSFLVSWLQPEVNSAYFAWQSWAHEIFKTVFPTIVHNT
jgi:hypothetical protein